MSLMTFRGLIDAHVHLREPGATHKEDFLSGSRAGVKGGFTYLLDMPNNPNPILTLEALEEKIKLSEKSICNIGFHFGTNGHNLDEFPKIWNHPKVFGLKIYCNHTTGNMLIEDEDTLDKIFSAWDSVKPILVHAEGRQLVLALKLANKYKRKLHVCHITQKIEVDLVKIAKISGDDITAGVTPHHLYFTKNDIFTPKGYGIMKPPLGTEEDRESLWQGLNDGTIDIVETDHAPHTKEEKNAENPPFGVPGLESALGLMCKGVKDGKIRKEDLIKFLYENPKRIFNIEDQDNSYVEFDLDEAYISGEEGYETKCGWSPFEGMTLYGKIHKVCIGGKILLENKKLI